MTKKSALVFGASGLVGKELLKLLLENHSYQSITTFGRNSLNIEHPKLKQIISSFDELESHQEIFTNKDVFCCLGTTIKKAKSKEAFRKVDLDYVVKIASIAKKTDVENFAVISSIGVTENSRGLYLKTKAEMELALQQLNFKKLVILRPSVLLGKRDEFRLSEQIGKIILKFISPVLIGKLKIYKGVEAKKVAQCMIDSMHSTDSGTLIIESDIINI